MKILIIIPTYNEDKNIINLINDIELKYKKYKILIIDDSSNLLTKKLINKSEFRNLEYFKRNTKLGRGNAVRFGFNYAVKNLYEYVIEMDGDYSHDPNEIQHLVKKIISDKSDLVIGSRYLPKSQILGWPLKRRLFSILANYFARILFSFKITDYTNGFRIYNMKSINELTKYKIKNHGFIYLTETLVILQKKNFMITEYPVVFNNRKLGKSSLKFKEILNSLYGIFEIKFRKI